MVRTEEQIREYDRQKSREWRLNNKQRKDDYNRKYRVEHLEYYKEYGKQYYQNHKEHMNEYANMVHEELKRELIMTIQGYVGCDICHIEDILLLEAHHLNVNGLEDRKRFEKRNGIFDKVKWMKYMIKHYHEEIETYPMQVLCANCHAYITQMHGPIWRERPEENMITLTDFIV